MHFDADKLAPFTLIYASMPILNETAGMMARDKASLRSLRRTGGPLSNDETDHVLSAVEALRNDDDIMWGGARFTLPAIMSLGKLDAQAVNGQMKAARRQYGGCVRELPPDFPANLPPYE